MREKIRVFIVDSSEHICHLLAALLGETDDVDVLGTAQDPVFALLKIRILKPDVVTLDAEMPQINGLEFLEELVRTDSIPVVIISAQTQKGHHATLQALELGAVDYIAKPSLDVTNRITSLRDEILEKIRIASKAKIKPHHTVIPHVDRGPVQNSECSEGRENPFSEKIIAIGASTGGTQAITSFLTRLPKAVPGIVVTQHMPPLFTASFAQRLNALCSLEIKEARTGDMVSKGTVLIAPGNKHLTIKKSGPEYYAEVVDGPLVNFVKPSVDVLFRSVASAAGADAIGIILTGMGEDGSEGLREMKNAGAFTIAQDETSSVVFGMPKRAIERGGVHKVITLDAMPGFVMELLSSRKK